MVHPTLHQCSDQTWLLEAMTAAEVLALEVGLIHSFKMAAIILNLAPHLLVQQQIYSWASLVLPYLHLSAVLPFQLPIPCLLEELHHVWQQILQMGLRSIMEDLALDWVYHCFRLNLQIVQHHSFRVIHLIPAIWGDHRLFVQAFYTSYCWNRAYIARILLFLGSRRIQLDFCPTDLPETTPPNPSHQSTHPHPDALSHTLLLSKWSVSDPFD